MPLCISVTLSLCISYVSVGVTFRRSKRSTFRRSKRSTFRRSKRTPDLRLGLIVSTAKTRVLTTQVQPRTNLWQFVDEPWMLSILMFVTNVWPAYLQSTFWLDTVPIWIIICKLFLSHPGHPLANPWILCAFFFLWGNGCGAVFWRHFTSCYSWICSQEDLLLLRQVLIGTLRMKPFTRGTYGFKNTRPHTWNHGICLAHCVLQTAWAASLGRNV